MFFYFTSAIIVGLIVHTLGKYTVMVNMFMVTFKFAAMALVVAALIFLYRKYRARKRSGHLRPVWSSSGGRPGGFRLLRPGKTLSLSRPGADSTPFA